VGPLATPDAVDTVERQVAQSIEKGARLIVGGKRMSGNGNYYMPTVIADIPPPEASVYYEEVFAPVAVLFKARSFDHAIELANDTPFGFPLSHCWVRLKVRRVTIHSAPATQTKRRLSKNSR
jgi:acyl-CoA reductase-like NAD-dependent aldehyde dehydrogenase